MIFQTLLQQNPQLKQHWQQAIDEIKANQRLRIGFWLVLGILLFYLGILISDSNKLAEKQLSQAKYREAKAIHLAKEGFWSDRARQSKLALYQLQTKFNHASTQGAAKATLHGLINSLTEQVALKEARISVDDSDDVNTPLRLWSFTVSINGSFDSNRIEKLLYLLSRHPYHLVVENLEISPNVSRFRMKIKYWFTNTEEHTQIKTQLASIKTNPNKTKSNQPKALSKSETEALKNGFPSEIFQ